MAITKLSASLVLAVFFFVLAPLSFHLVAFAGKPIYVMLSDVFLYALFGLKIFFPERVTSQNFSFSKLYMLAGLLYFTILSFSSAIYRGGDLGVIFSYAKYVLPFAYYFFGASFSGFVSEVNLRRVALFLCLLVVVIFASDLLLGEFPRGCHLETGRWGGCAAKIEVYGFPNSAASLYGLIFLIIAAFMFSGILRPFVALVVLFFLGIIMLLSLSRAAWIFLCLDLLFISLFLLFYSRRKIWILIFFICIILPIFFLIGQSDSSAFLPVLEKFNTSLERSDPSSGRFDIWLSTLEYVFASPVYGYGFSPFSNYVAGYDTPHQQYLEWAFKAGFIGVIFNLSILGLIVLKSYQVSAGWNDFQKKRVFRFFSTSAVLALLVNGLFQPIFSYTPVANFLFFCLGALTYFVGLSRGREKFSA